MKTKIFLWFKADLSKVVDYQGRAGRQEASCFLFCECLVLAALYLLGRNWVFFSYLCFLFFCLTIIPTILLLIRRLHDLDLCGWWVLLAMWPPICFFLVCYPGKSKKPNRFGFEERLGLDPKEQHKEEGISTDTGITYFEEPSTRHSCENCSK